MLPPMTSLSRKSAYRSGAEWWRPGKPMMRWTCSSVLLTMFTPGLRTGGIAVRSAAPRSKSWNPALNNSMTRPWVTFPATAMMIRGGTYSSVKCPSAVWRS